MATITIDNQVYTPVKDFRQMEYLTRQPVLAFATKVKPDMSGYETNYCILYAGRLDKKRRRVTDKGDMSGYAIYGAVQYRLIEGRWVEQEGKSVVGISESDFEARAVHCPEFFYSEGVIE